MLHFRNGRIASSERPENNSTISRKNGICRKKVSDLFKLFHRILFFLCAVVCLYQVSEFLKVYFKYETNIKVKIEVIKNADVPAMSYCTHVRTRRDIFCSRYPKMCMNFSFPEINTLIRNLTSEERIAMALPHGLICQVMFAPLQMSAVSVARPCNASNLLFFSTGDLNCFSFNVDLNNSIPNIHTRAHSAKLQYRMPKMKLSADEKNGLKVFVHPRGVLPSFRHSPISIQKGKECTIHFSKVIVHRLEAPYVTNCTRYTDGARDDPLLPVFNRDNCYTRCLWNASMHHCGCILEKFGFLRGFKLCRIEEYEKCETRLHQIEVGNLCNVRCPTECFSEYFETTGTCTEPWQAYYERQQMGEMYSDFLLQLSTVTQTTYQHVARIEGIQVFSTIGGYIGIWLGISIFSILEQGEAIGIKHLGKKLNIH